MSKRRPFELDPMRQRWSLGAPTSALVALLLFAFACDSEPRGGGSTDARTDASLDAAFSDRGQPDSGPDTSLEPDAAADARAAPDAAPMTDAQIEDAGEADGGPPDADPPDASPPDGALMDCQPACNFSAHCIDGRCEPSWHPILESGAWYGDGRVHLRLIWAHEGDDTSQIRPRAGGQGFVSNFEDFPVFVRDDTKGYVTGYADLPIRPETVDIYDDGVRVLRIPVANQHEAQVGDACPIRDPAVRCERNSRCLRVAPCHPIDDSSCLAPIGECVASSAQIWQAGDAFFLDIRTEVEPQLLGHRILDLRIPGQTLSWWNRGGTPGPRRWLSRLSGPNEGPVPIYDWVVKAFDNVAPQPAERVATGEPCDPGRAATICEEDTICIQGTCRHPRPPVITHAVLVRTAEAWAVLLRGDDPDQDLEGVNIWVDHQVHGSGTWRQTGFDQGWIRWDGPRFEAWMGDARPLPDGERYSIELADRERGRVRVDVVPVAESPEPPGGVGASCDPDGLVLPCEAGLICSASDGAVPTDTRCQRPDPVCGGALDAPVQVDPEDGPLVHTSCVYLPIGTHRAHFTAPADGRFRFTARSDASIVLSVRGSCIHLGSEMGCTLARRGERPAVLTLDLQAEQTVSVLVHSQGAPFELTAEAVP
jgi:hypothetical protein